MSSDNKTTFSIIASLKPEDRLYKLLINNIKDTFSKISRKYSNFFMEQFNPLQERKLSEDGEVKEYITAFVFDDIRFLISVKCVSIEDGDSYMYNIKGELNITSPVYSIKKAKIFNTKNSTIDFSGDVTRDIILSGLSNEDELKKILNAIINECKMYNKCISCYDYVRNNKCVDNLCDKCIYRKQKENKEEYKEFCCAICQEGYDNDKVITKVKSCGHQYHLSCVVDMYNNEAKKNGNYSTCKCPLCRSDFKLHNGINIKLD